MFELTLEQIFSSEALYDASQQISRKSIGLDEQSFKEFSKNLRQNLNELQKELFTSTFIPEPLKRIDIPKDGGELRPLGLGSIKDKIVQNALHHALSKYFEKLFSNKSYAYRSGKSVKTAINRSVDFMRNGKTWVLKSDIKSFFESISQQKLNEILAKHIKDKRLLSLLSLFIQNGIFAKRKYQNHEIGVHQGDIISPLLSNIYLDLFDKILDKNNIDFIRYADDFCIFCASKQEALNAKALIISTLKSLDLKLNEEKTRILNSKEESFVFLGASIKNLSKEIAPKSLEKISQKLNQIAKIKEPLAFKNELEAYFKVLLRYHFSIASNWQESFIKDECLNTIAKFLTNSTLKNQKAKRTFLANIDFSRLFSEPPTGQILSKASQTPNNPQKELNKKRNIYAKKFADDSTLHIARSGVFLGLSANSFVLKEQGKIIKKIPFEKVSRIIFEGKKTSLSTALIAKAANSGINIDFIGTDYVPYATLISYKATISQNLAKQARLIGTPKALAIAKEFINAKITNQTNYLKYLSKYHSNLETPIKEISQILTTKIHGAKSQAELMGYEGAASAIYWQGLKSSLKVDFSLRITKGAKDLVNSCLNYAYAILYGVVQKYLFSAGLCLHLPFLHAPQGLKPTLSFDVIEEFRSFIVDRTIISMLNKNEPLKVNKDGFLDDKSKALISQNIKEKLGSYTKWRKQNIMVEDIIKTQCYALSRCVFEDARYHGFIGKF